MSTFKNKGVIFAQIGAKTSSVYFGLPKKTYYLFDSNDKVSQYLEVTGNEFKQLFYNSSSNFSMPNIANGKNILGDFCHLDQWCVSSDIGEIIKPPYFFDFINTVFISWQKDLGINICEWGQINTKRLNKELKIINSWIKNKNYRVIKSLNYQELINTLKTPKLMKGNLIHLSILIKNENPNISTIEIVLNFRISEDEK